MSSPTRSITGGYIDRSTPRRPKQPSAQQKSRCMSTTSRAVCAGSTISESSVKTCLPAISITAAPFQAGRPATEELCPAPGKIDLVAGHGTGGFEPPITPSHRSGSTDQASSQASCGRRAGRGGPGGSRDVSDERNSLVTEQPGGHDQEALT